MAELTGVPATPQKAGIRGADPAAGLWTPAQPPAPLAPVHPDPHVREKDQLWKDELGNPEAPKYRIKTKGGCRGSRKDQLQEQEVSRPRKEK